MNCDKCMHSGLCIYEEGARIFEKSLEDVEKSKPALISFNLACEKFQFKFNPARHPKAVTKPKTEAKADEK